MAETPGECPSETGDKLDSKPEETELDFEEEVTRTLSEQLFDMEQKNREMAEKLAQLGGLSSANQAMMDSLNRLREKIKRLESERAESSDVDAVQALKDSLVNQQEKIERLEAEKAEALHEAAHDALTQLLEREPFLQELEEKYLSINHPDNVRKMKQGAIAFIDLNQIKQLNEQVGYQSTDQVISEFAKRLKATMRRYDMAMRYGGDEFVLYLHDADPNQIGYSIARRIKEGLASNPISVEDVQGKPQEIDISFCVGIAAIPRIIARAREAGESITDTLLEISSERSKIAKRESGHNTTVVTYRNERGEIINLKVEDSGS